MKFVLELALSRMRRQKKRLLFVLLAIAASSCLVVWTIGGFQALFIDASTGDVDYLGRYDLAILGNPFGQGGRGGGGSFGGPFANRSETPKEPAKDASKDAGARENRGRGGRGGGPERGGRGGDLCSFDALVSRFRADESVAICDAVSTLRAFVYSPGAVASILQDEDADDEGVKPTIKRALELSDEEYEKIGEAPEGIDPKLRRAAFGAYRATMGTPLGMGSLYFATDATESPYELKDGRWFRTRDDASDRAPREAVVTTKGNERLRAKVGDSIFLIEKTSLIDATYERQLEVVGIVEDAETDGFYISRDLALEFARGEPLPTSAIYLKVRGDLAEFRARWDATIAESSPGATILTKAEIAEAKAAAIRDNTSFKYQTVSGTILAALASLLIVFTALTTSVDEDKRLIAFYRVAGATRSQVGLSVLFESIALATPGWIAGMLVGWFVVWICSGKATGLNWKTVGFSVVCSFLGAIVASLYPILKSLRVKPLDAISGEPVRAFVGRRRRLFALVVLLTTIVGLACVFGDLALVYGAPAGDPQRAALQSGIGVLLLALGVLLLLPLAILVAETIITPILARVFRLDPRLLRGEFAGNAWRVVAVAAALSVGGGLFATMQIWGYSMLDPFLPGRRFPDAFVAFLPNGLRPEIVEQLKSLPEIDKDRFVSVAVEQAAFAEGSAAAEGFKSQFANVVFFGCDVDKAFLGRRPLVGARFRQGSPKEAFSEMAKGRGVVVTDSMSTDFGLNLGDILKVVHPREPSTTLEYPIVGVVSFPGWQWLSKTGGVRRNFGRSGGIVFANEDVVANDFQIERQSYFWFDAAGGEKLDYGTLELECDFLARRNLDADIETGAIDESSFESRTAYAKISTRDSLTESITRRADSVIWGLSKTPITTLIIASIAVVGAIANSVRARRWRYGVARAVGATRWTIVRAVLIEAILIGLVATFASFSFGFIAAKGALKLGESLFGTFDPPLVLPTLGLLTGLGLTVALCLVAALYPAIKTARTEPLSLLQSGRAPD